MQFSMTAIHVFQQDQMQAAVMAQHYLPLPSEKKMFAFHKTGANFVVSLLMDYLLNGTLEETFFT